MDSYLMELFEGESKEETSAQNPVKGPGPPVRKHEENSRYLDLKIVHKEEVMKLFNATMNRAYLPKYNYQEMQDISDKLVEALEKSGRPIESIVSQAEKILELMRNLYATQAIEFAMEGDSYNILKSTEKKKIIRR